MARIEVALPDLFIFNTRYQVTAEDINYGGHVGNDRFLGIANVLRLRWLKSLGYKDELSLGSDTGTIISDAAVQYKAEAFEGDVLDCRLGIRDVSKYGFDLIYVLDKDERPVTLIKTGILTINYRLRKVVSIPDKFRSQLLSEEP